MLTTCPECNLPVSDKAITCPHCGYPLKHENMQPRTRKKHHAHRRLPNGFGRITKINRNLANPYRVMVTVGHDENGKPIGKLLKPKAYFPTYNDAYLALVEYNRAPYDLDKNMTVEELYEKWYASVEDCTARSTLKGYQSAWKYCESIKKMPVRNVRISHVRHCFEHGSYTENNVIRTAPDTMKVRVKRLLNMILDYAVEHELVEKNVARSIGVPKKITAKANASTEHIRFTTGEMKTLWENYTRVKFADVVLFQCYSGWRPRELGLLKLSDVDLDRWEITGGMKTEAGSNRTVPVHTCVRPIVKELYERAKNMHSEYLVNDNDPAARRMTYSKYHYRFSKVVEKLGLDERHRPHDPRKQFVSMAKDAGVNEYAIKRLVGHAISDITEKIYTEHDPDWLAKEIEKIKRFA